MSEFRAVSVRAGDIETLEEAMEALYRAHDNTLALRLGALALRLREASGFHHERVFACDVDESAGMAEIVELNCFSRRVGA